MKNVKAHSKVLLIMALLVIALIGCSKDNEGERATSEYFIKFKVNGNQKMYDPLFANTLPLNNISVQLFSENNIGIVGIKNPVGEADKNSMTLIVMLLEENLIIRSNTEYNNMDITTNEDGIPNMAMGFGYFDENGNEYGSSTAKEIKINFTEITDTSVKGNFSGELININFETIQITDGEFNATNFQ